MPTPKPNSKHEYEVLVTRTEVYSVFVKAENYEEAEELAEEKYYNGDAELQRTSTVCEVNWSDEED